MRNNKPRHCEEAKLTRQSTTLRLLWIASLTLAMTALASSAYAKALDIKEVKSPGGISAWLVEDHSIPVIALDFAFKDAGSKNEAVETQGLVRVLSNTMDEGAGDLDSKAFQKELLDKSISLSFNATRDNFGGELKTLSRHKDRAFELLTLALTKPRFDADAVTRMIAANESRIKTSLADPEWIAARLMNDIAYKGHPYALNSGGTLSTLATITPDQLRAYLKDQLSRDRLKIGVAGDITEAELAALLDKIFGGLPAKTTSTKTASEAGLSGGGTVTLYSKDIPQTVIEIMQPGIKQGNPDYHTAEIMNFVLGGSGFGSRLMEQIREKRGLTYGIYSGLLSMDHTAAVTVGTSTKNESVGEMLDLIKAEWSKMQTDGITEQELEDAKSYLIGSLPLSLTSTDRISGLLLSLQTEGFEKNYLEKREAAIKAASASDIKSIAAKLLDPAKFTIVLVGKPEGIEPTQTVTTLPNAE